MDFLIQGFFSRAKDFVLSPLQAPLYKMKYPAFLIDATITPCGSPSQYHQIAKSLGYLNSAASDLGYA